MPADAANQNQIAQAEAAGAPVAKEAPTEQQQSQTGIPKKITNAQTVCNEKNAKGKLCNGHLKQLKTGGEEAEKHLRGDDVLFRCQTCGTLYMGPPLGHVRDPEKQSRFVEKELTSILRAAGGTLPAFKKSPRGTLVPLEEDASHHAPAPASAAAKPSTPAAAAKPASPAVAAPANETPEERKARLIAEAQARKAAGGAGAAVPGKAAAAKPSAAPSASTSGTDSSPAADRHRPAAEAQAATGQASAAPMSSTASTASPAAGAETVSDLAPEASTELTPGAPPDERQADAPQASRSQPGGEDSKAS